MLNRIWEGWAVEEESQEKMRLRKSDLKENQIQWKNRFNRKFDSTESEDSTEED